MRNTLFNRPLLVFKLHGDETLIPTLLETSSFLYDFNLLYEISRLAVDYRYVDFSFSNSVYLRGARPLRSEDQLFVKKLSQESPIDLQTAIVFTGGVIAAVWALLQSVEKIENWSLNKRKLKAEVILAEAEAAKMSREHFEENTIQPSPFSDAHFLNHHLEERGAIDSLKQTEKRLGKSPIRILDFSIDFDWPKHEK